MWIVAKYENTGDLLWRQTKNGRALVSYGNHLGHLYKPVIPGLTRNQAP
jgi:hypothetical protein